MAKIEAYKPRVTPIAYDDLKGSNPPAFYVNHDETGGWHPKTKAITPFKASYDDHSVEEWLQNITAAVEAGSVDSTTFLQDFFGTPAAAAEFADQLESYGSEEWWVNDRYFNAVMAALNGYEGNCYTFEAMAEAVRDRVEGWAKNVKKPAAKKAR